MSANKTKTMPVAVHKASISLESGESIEDFIRKLSDAGREHIMSKLNLTSKSNGGAWMVEAFGDYIVFSTYKDEEPSKYFAFTYKRNDDDSFEFGKAIEVEKVTSFKPKNDIEISKVEKAMQEANKALDRLEIGTWKQVDKNIWKGVF